VIVCESGEGSGTTGTDSSILDLQISFENCSMNEVLAVEAECQGSVRLIAQNASTDTATIQLLDDFSCVFTTDICAITLAGPQTSQDNNVELDETDDRLVVDADFNATRTGSALCGPASGTMTISGQFSVSPSNLAIDS
jgi:hypothetical protein